MVRWPVGEEAVVVLWLSQWNRDGPRVRSRLRVEGEKRASQAGPVEVVIGACAWLLPLK